jgi:hypothetical protein
MLMLSLFARPNHVFNEFLCTAAQVHASAGFPFRVGCLDRGTRHPGIEWQSTVKHDLTQEHSDRIGGAQAYFREYPRGTRFKFRLDPGG